jgi:hypothetical protein
MLLELSSMPNYEITIANKDVDAFRAAFYELYPNTPIQSSRPLIFARKFDVDITEEEYVFLSLKFKFLKPKITILKPRTDMSKAFWIKYPNE